jgi:hypothetical protein
VIESVTLGPTKESPKTNNLEVTAPNFEALEMPQRVCPENDDVLEKMTPDTKSAEVGVG